MWLTPFEQIKKDKIIYRLAADLISANCHWSFIVMGGKDGTSTYTPKSSLQ